MNPIAKITRKIYPTLFKGKDTSPSGLKKHFGTTTPQISRQGAYTKYHMNEVMLPSSANTDM